MAYRTNDNGLTPHRGQVLNTLRPRLNGCHFLDDICKCIFLKENVWISMIFHWNLCVRVKLTMFQLWFGKRFGASQATSLYLNQWRLIYWCIYASLGLNESVNWTNVDQELWGHIYCAARSYCSNWDHWSDNLYLYINMINMNLSLGLHSLTKPTTVIFPTH